MTNFNEFYGDLWASITFPHQECHNYGFCILLSLQLHHIHMLLVSTLRMHHCCFCIANSHALLLPYFCMLFFNFLFWYVLQTIWLFDQLFCLICASFCVLLVLVLHISKLFGFVRLMCCASAIHLDFMLHLLFKWVFSFRSFHLLFVFILF